MPGQFQGFRVYQIDIGGGNSKNDTVGFRNVLGDEVSRLLLDICRLIADGYLQLLASFRAESPSPPTLVSPGKSTSVKLRTCGE